MIFRRPILEGDIPALDMTGSAKPRRKAASPSLKFSNGVLLSRPITGNAGCSARTASGNDGNEAAAPSPAMKFRRLICNPQGSKLAP
jgi:hypothetical protein